MPTRLRFSKNAEKLLREVSKRRHLQRDKFGHIRTGMSDGYECPLCAIYNTFFRGDNEYGAMNSNFIPFCGNYSESELLRFKKMGLTPATVRKIVWAADYPTDLMRPRLLHLLGLTQDKEV